MDADDSLGMQIRWEQFQAYTDTKKPESSAAKTTQLVHDLAKTISTFQDTTDSLIDTYSEIMVIIEKLEICPYDAVEFSTLLTSVQTIIDKFNLTGFSNLSSWVAGLDKKIEVVLITRLRTALDLWCTEFAKDGENSISDSKRKIVEDVKVSRLTLSTFPNTDEAHQTGGIVFETLLHEIRIKNQVIYLEPPIEHARASWYKQLHSSLAVICGLKRIQAARYENSMKLRKPFQEDQDYTSLVLSSDQVLTYRY